MNWHFFLICLTLVCGSFLLEFVFPGMITSVWSFYWLLIPLFLLSLGPKWILRPSPFEKVVSFIFVCFAFILFGWFVSLHQQAVFLAFVLLAVLLSAIVALFYE